MEKGEERNRTDGNLSIDSWVGGEGVRARVQSQCNGSPSCPLAE